jgi:hypothetical protein
VGSHSSAQADVPAPQEWPLPKRRRAAPFQSDSPSKTVFFDGPHAEEILRAVESKKLLTGWGISDTMLYFMWLGIRQEVPDKSSVSPSGKIQP